MNTRHGDLPLAWRRPRQDFQSTLFPRPTAEALAELSVSLDDTGRWQQLGWLSFDATKLTEVDEPEYQEVCFVRNIARSGLPDSQITELLSQLEKPYGYNPDATAYHFQYGWVTPKSDDPYEIIEGHLSDWINDRASDGDLDSLQDLRDQLDEHLGEAEADDNDESESTPRGLRNTPLPLTEEGADGD